MLKLIAGLSLILISFALFFRFLLFRGFKAPRVVERGTPADSGISFTELSIPTRNSKFLHAWFLPKNPQAACVVIMHGWGGNAEVMLPVCVPFLDAGLNVLVLDARGHGLSDEDRFSSLPKFAEDVEACIDWLHEQHDLWNGHLVLLGHSVGAGAVLLTASRDRRVDAVISIAAFSHPRSMMQRYLYRFPSPVRRVIINQVQRIIGHTLDDIAPMYTIRNIDCPALIVHGLDDVTVPVAEARKIVDSAGKDSVKLVLIEGASHDSVEKFLESGGRLIVFLGQHGLIEAKVPTRSQPDRYRAG